MWSVACMGVSVQGFGRETWGKKHSEDLGIDGRIILIWTFKRYSMGSDLDSCGSGYRQVVGSCKHGNEIIWFVISMVSL